MSKIAMILSGCGVYDGSEIHEATLAYYFLEKAGFDVSFFAPNNQQRDCINHQTGEASKDSRNCLEEAARIARGKISDLKEVNTTDFDGAVFPGGFGAAKNLSDYAVAGTDLTVQEDVAAFVTAMHQANKPQAFICIAPVIAAKLIPGVTITLGLDQATADSIETLGVKTRQAQYDDVVVDNENNVYSTPAYMLDASISEIALGIEKCIQYMREAIPVVEEATV